MLFESLHKFELHVLHEQYDTPACLQNVWETAEHKSDWGEHPRSANGIPFCSAFITLKFKY